MKKLIFILSMMLLSCKEKKPNPPRELNTEKIEILFPEFNEWKEMYSYPKVKLEFDRKNNNGTRILGVYLNNETIKFKDSLDVYDFEDYAVVLNRINDQKWKINSGDLDYVSDKMQDYMSISENAKKSIDHLRSDTIAHAFYKPLLLEQYWINKDIQANLTLVQPYKDEPGIIIVMIMNSINVRNHLTYLAYYLDLDGIESLKKAKKNNYKIAVAFEKLNRE